MACIYWIILLLIRSSWGYMEETYPLMDEIHDLSPYLYPDDLSIKNEVYRRSSGNNYLRFGRAGPLNDDDYDFEDFARPTRSGKTEKNDHFIRFGRGRQDFMRFGRDSHKDRTNYLRFGRSIVSDEKKRAKRETTSYNEPAGLDYKRGSNFLRFGRNSNYMRFGRQENLPTAKSPDLHESPLWQLLNDLLVNLKMNNNRKCTAV